MQFKSYSKINLGLNILNKRSDNFHNIQSLFIELDFSDYISFIPNDKFDLKIIGNNKIDPKKNTIIDAINEISKVANLNLTHKIEINKNIPIGSGLGGGSSNAACILNAINKIYKLNKSDKELKKIGLQIGSDVPVCFYSKNAKVSNIGDIVKPLRILEKKLWVLLIKPNSFYSTKYIFANFKDSYEKKSRFSYTLNNIIKDMNKYKNSLENTLCKVENNIGRIITNLSSNDSLTIPRITGSGSVIFVVFETKEALYNYHKKLNVNRRDHWIKATYIEL